MSELNSANGWVWPLQPRFYLKTTSSKALNRVSWTVFCWSTVTLSVLFSCNCLRKDHLQYIYVQLRSNDFYNFQVAIPGPFEEKPVVDWGFSLRLCDLVRHVCIPCCYMIFVSMQFLFLLHILNLPVYLRVWFCTVLWWHEDGETLMPKATRTRSSQFRRRRLIGVIFLSEARPFRGFLPVTTWTRNPQSNQVQFVWTFYQSSLPPLWMWGDQVSCGSKCSKVKISENSCNQLHSGASCVLTLCSRGQSSRCQRALHSWAMNVGRDNRGQPGQHLKCLRILYKKMQNVTGGIIV